MVKKLSEFTILCGVEACAVTYPPGSNTQPEAWPSTVAARRLISEYKTLPSNRMEENHSKELIQVMFQSLGRKGLQNVKKEDLDELGWLIDQNLKDIDERIHALVTAYAYGGKVD
ncbi:hypothetical protein V6N13_030696 [Hibiscus sabdariffa]|uniref:MADS-box domain-containing protein n=1 Tax=Hibiscus sabdariffa TaxID=183260 RepID=A0ABR2D5Z4_9ROSI